MVCDTCDFSGLSIRCSVHMLVGGKNGIAQTVKELHQNTLNGGMAWGDLVYEEEQEIIAAETPEQKAARLKRLEMADEEQAEKLKAYALQKLAMLNTDAQTGALKHKTYRCCRDAEEPAKWVVGKKKLGNYQEWPATDPKALKKPSVRPKGVPPHAIFWPYGCEPHMKGCCPHLHPDEPGYADAKAGKKFVAAEAIMAKAVYISNKPVAKPSPLQKQVVMDAW